MFNLNTRKKKVVKKNKNLPVRYLSSNVKFQATYTTNFEYNTNMMYKKTKLNVIRV